MLHADQRHAKSTAEDEVTPTIMKVVITRKLLMLKGLDPIMRKHAFIEEGGKEGGRWRDPGRIDRGRESSSNKVSFFVTVQC